MESSDGGDLETGATTVAIETEAVNANSPTANSTMPLPLSMRPFQFPLQPTPPESPSSSSHFSLSSFPLNLSIPPAPVSPSNSSSPILRPSVSYNQLSSLINSPSIPPISNESSLMPPTQQQQQIHLPNSPYIGNSTQKEAAQDASSQLPPLPDSLVRNPALAYDFAQCLMNRVHALQAILLDVDGSPIVPIDHLRTRMRFSMAGVDLRCVRPPHFHQTASSTRPPSPPFLHRNPAADTAAAVLGVLEHARNEGTTDSSSNSQNTDGVDFDLESVCDNNDFTYEPELSDEQANWLSPATLFCPLHRPADAASELGTCSYDRGIARPESSSIGAVTDGVLSSSPSSSSISSSNTLLADSSCDCVLCRHPSIPVQDLELLLHNEEKEKAEAVARNEEIIQTYSCAIPPPERDLDLEQEFLEGKGYLYDIYLQQKPSSGYFFKPHSRDRRLPAVEERFLESIRSWSYARVGYPSTCAKLDDTANQTVLLSDDATETRSSPAFLEERPMFGYEDADATASGGKVPFAGFSDVVVPGIHCDACASLWRQRRRRLVRDWERRRRRFGMVGGTVFAHNPEEETSSDGFSRDGDDDDDDDDEEDDDGLDGDASGGYSDETAYTMVDVDTVTSEDLDGNRNYYDSSENHEYYDDDEEDSEDDDDEEDDDNDDEDDEDDEEESDEFDDEEDEVPDSERDSVFWQEMNDDEREEAFLDEYTSKIQELIGLQEVVWRIEQLSWPCR